MLTRFAILLLALLVYGSPASAQKRLKTVRTNYERGMLRDKQPVGRWEYLDINGQPELIFDYDSSRIVFIKPDTGRYWLQTPSGWQLQRPARAPRLLGSYARDMSQLGRSMVYPLQSLRTGRQGDVLISFIVGPDGQAHDFLIEQSLSPDCDQELWRALSQNFYHWIPAIYQGRPVAAKFYLLATFCVGPCQDERQALRQPQAGRQPLSYGHCLGQIVVTGNIGFQAR